MHLRLTAAAAAAVLALGAAACSSNDSATTTTEGSESTTTTTTLPQSFQVATPDGQVSLSLDGKLPPGWPRDFPVPASAEPAGSGSLGNADTAVRVGVYRTDEGGEETLDFYTQDQDLATTGRTAAGVGESFVGRLSLTSPYTGTINVVSHQGTTYLVITLKGDTTASTTSTTGPGGASTSAPAASATTTSVAPGTPQ